MSKKFSRHRARRSTIFVAPAWSAPLPKVMVPRQISDTLRPGAAEIAIVHLFLVSFAAAILTAGAHPITRLNAVLNALSDS